MTGMAWEEEEEEALFLPSFVGDPTMQTDRAIVKEEEEEEEEERHRGREEGARRSEGGVNWAAA